MAVNETGQEHLTAGIDDLRRRPDEAGGILVSTEPGDAVAADGDSFCPGMAWVYGIGARMLDDDIRVRFARLVSAGA